MTSLYILVPTDAELGAGLPVGMAAVAARDVPGNGGIAKNRCWLLLESLHGSNLLMTLFLALC